MNLTIDIGNSTIKAAVFNGHRLADKCVIEQQPSNRIKAFVKKHPAIEHVILSSVKSYPASVKLFLKKNFNFIELSAAIPLPFTNAYKTPKTLGSDRLAAIAGTYCLFPKQNALVVNAGTCVTYDFIDAKATYYGGSISPGLAMRFKALHTFTGRLPLIKADNSFNKLIGTTTVESILAGVQQGMQEEISGYIRTYKKQYGSLQVIITGGSATWLKTKLQEKIIVEPYLTLKGLNVLLAFYLTLKKSNT